MIRLFFVLFTLLTFLYSGEFKRLNLNEMYDIVVIEENYDIYDSKGKVARFYQEERNGDLRHLFNLTLEDKTGTCSARSVEEGSYEVNGTTLTLYTSWDRQGRIYDVPYGVKVTAYCMDENGTLEQIRSQIYVETAKKSFNKKSGMRFLFIQPVNEEEKQALAAYIERAQQRFKGTFLRGEKAEALKQEVRSALDRKMEKRWK